MIKDTVLKICSNCGKNKEIGYFYFRKDSRKYHNQCGICCSHKKDLVKYEFRKQQRLISLEEVKQLVKRGQKRCRKCNIIKFLEEIRSDFRSSSKIYAICYECDNRKERYRKNPERGKNQATLWRINNKNRAKETAKNYYKLNREKLRIKARKYYKNRLLTDVNFKIQCSLRAFLKSSFKRINSRKVHKTIEYFGCTLIQLKAHLESLFIPGMTWKNRGLGILLGNDGKPIYDSNNNTIPIKAWQIDHIIPCASFDLSDIEQQKKCFHYSNLQPLWAEDNFKKSDYMPDGSRGRHRN